MFWALRTRIISHLTPDVHRLYSSPHQGRSFCTPSNHTAPSLWFMMCNRFLQGLTKHRSVQKCSVLVDLNLRLETCSNSQNTVIDDRTGIHVRKQLLFKSGLEIGPRWHTCLEFESKELQLPRMQPDRVRCSRQALMMKVATTNMTATRHTTRIQTDRTRVN